MKRTKAQYHYSIRRCKNAVGFIKNDKLLGALIEGDKDLFAAIKKLRESKKEVASVVDNKIGPQNIANHFGKQYKNLYNQQESRNDMNELLEDICHIDDEQVDLADLITSKLVKEIMQDKIKSNKSDVQQDFNSDCLKNSPDILYAQLALVLKSLLIHGFMPAILLLCAIVPLVKDPSGSLDDSSNYRGIAISSLFLKVWDDLGSDELQFGFKKNSSCSLCTWSVLETINYYKRGGSVVFGCLLDCQKAFDTVDHVKLFKKIRERIPLIFVRILLVIYIDQRCYVRWNGAKSEEFNVMNGVRQGAVLSPLLFSIYINELIQKLRYSGIGCWIGNKFSGIFAYADDLIILAPRREALQRMIEISETFMTEHKIFFSTKKTKCMYFATNRSDSKDIIKKV